MLHIAAILQHNKHRLAEIVTSPHDTDGEKPCAFRFEIV